MRTSGGFDTAWSFLDSDCNLRLATLKAKISDTLWTEIEPMVLRAEWSLVELRTFTAVSSAWPERISDEVFLDSPA